MLSLLLADPGSREWSLNKKVGNQGRASVKVIMTESRREERSLYAAAHFTVSNIDRRDQQPDSLKHW